MRRACQGSLLKADTDGLKATTEIRRSDTAKHRTLRLLPPIYFVGPTKFGLWSPPNVANNVYSIVVGRPGWVAGGVISGIGLVLALLHTYHGIQEINEGLPAVIYGVAFPLIVSLLILGSGFWIARHPWSDAKPYRITGWFVGGGSTGVVLIGLLMLYQAAEAVTLSHPLFVSGMFATYGGAIGLLLGRYDLHRQIERERQRRRSERLEQFAGIVSHDLRNPLNVAEGRIESARGECESEQLDTASQALARMETLIDDMLSLARAGKTVGETEAVELMDLVDVCWRNVEMGSAKLVTETEITIQADKTRLQQLLENLFRNAVEHGGANVTIRVGDIPDGFYIEDDGPGIPDEDRNQVIEPGYSTSGGGTGFGLSIVRDIGAAHGWDMEVTSGDDGGARFEFTGIQRV